MGLGISALTAFAVARSPAVARTLIINEVAFWGMLVLYSALT